MLGSRFDFKAKLDELGARRTDADRKDEARQDEVRQDLDRRERSCVELERDIAVVARTVVASTVAAKSVAAKSVSAKTVHAEAGNGLAGGEGGVSRIAFRCPVCDDVMRLGGESELGEFAGLDVKLHRLECDSCGMVTGRVYHPDIGYHDRLVR